MLEHSKKQFTKRDQLKDDVVRRFQHIAIHLSEDTIILSEGTNVIKNSTINRRDVLVAKDMLGVSNHAIKGKLVRYKTHAVDVSFQNIDAPRSIMKFYKATELATDVTHANDVPFLTNELEQICCGKIAAVDDLKCHSLRFELKNIIRSCAIR